MQLNQAKEHSLEIQELALVPKRKGDFMSIL